MSARVITVVAPSRLHLGMFSFGRPDVRQFGGVGIMIAEPRLEVEVRAATEFQAVGIGSERVGVFARRLVEAGLLRALPPARVDVLTAPPPHFGLGSGTQLALSVASGLLAFAEAPRPPVEQLAAALGRGRRSAIGLHGFIHGGLIVEAGKLANDQVGPLVARLDVPQAWRFVLMAPPATPGLSGEAERQAFETLPPVPAAVTDEICRRVLMQLVPAARTGNLAEFGEAVFRIGELAGSCFAKAQGGVYASPQAAELVDVTRRLGVRGVSQTSWGPTVFAVLPDEPAARQFGVDIARQVECRYIVTAARNFGASIAAKS